MVIVTLFASSCSSSISEEKLTESIELSTDVESILRNYIDVIEIGIRNNWSEQNFEINALIEDIRHHSDHAKSVQLIETLGV